MLRKTLFSLVFLTIPLPSWGQDIPLQLQGDTAVVKVAKVITTYEDRVVVKSFTPVPLIIAPADIGFYRWTYPAAVKATDKGNVLQVDYAPQGDSKVSLKVESAVVVDGKVKYVTKFSDFILSVGVPSPNPVDPPKPPDPDPIPPPKPPQPQPVTSFRVIFVAESGKTLTKEQNSVIAGKVTRDWLTANTTPEGKYAGWRHFDPQQTVLDEQPNMRKLWEAVQPKLTAVPCAVVEVNGHAEIIPLAATPSEMVATFDSYRKGGK